MTDSPDPAALKRAAAMRAVEFVLDGMKLGLGTGSTAEAFLEVLAPRVRGGMKIVADETDRALVLIKGGGGALLREKIVAASSKKMIVIADASKLVPTLGKFPLPVEVSTFGHVTTLARIVNVAAKLGYARLQPQLRTKDGAPYKTDGGNYIYDCPFGAITDASALASALSGTVGVIDHGLFVGLASALVIAREDKVEVIER
jgi:ribose 5-phosphate isomerase A